MPDSTPPKPQTREIASIVGYGRDITRSYLGKLLEPQDKVLARKWYDYEVYEDLLRDDQVKSVFQQRRSAVVAREWEVTPGGDKRIDKQAADFIRETLGRMGWDNVSDKMLFGVFYGYAIGECLWAREGNKIQLATIKVRKQRRFKFDWDMKPRLITWGNNYEGEALPEYKFWHYSTGADNDDDPYGLGLAHWLYWPTYFKRNGIKSWLKFLERFAQPTAKGTYGPGAEAAEKAALKQALQAFGEDAAVMVPEGVEIALIEAARSGTADYGGLCDRMDRAISKIILSQTMTTDNGSSKSQAEVHNGVKLDVVKADADLIDASANNTWVKWLTDWNFPGAAHPKIGRKLEDEENLNDRAVRDKGLSEMGFRLTPEKVVEIYGDGYYDPASLEDESGDQPPLVSVLGVGGTEALVGFLTALSQMSLKRENAIATLVTVFGISQSDAEAMVPEDAAPEAAAPPASIDDAAALFSEAPADLLKALEPIGQQFADALNPKLFGVLQSLDRAAGDGEFAESDEDAAIGRRFVEVLEFGDRPNDLAFAVLQVLDQSMELDMLTFAETESNVAMEGAIGRRLLALIKPGVVDFASGGGKKCTKGLSCGGSCISKAKVCVKAMNPAQKKQYGEIVKAVKAGGEGADKAMEDFKASLKSESANSDIPPRPELADGWQTLPLAEMTRISDAHQARMAEWRSSLTPDQRRRELAERTAREAEERRQAEESARNELRPSDADLAKAQSAVKARIASGEIPKPKPQVAKPYEFNVDVEAPPDTLNMTGDRFFNDRTMLSVSFDVNGSYDLGAATEGNERRIGRTTFKYFRGKFKELPDGLILHNTPNQGDGAGARRKRVYKTAGFGEADDNNQMYGVIKGGKLIPLTGAEAFALSEMNRNSKD